MSILHLNLVHFYKNQSFTPTRLKIELENWRSIHSIKKTNSIQLTSQDFGVYDLLDTTISEILQVIQNNDEIEKKGQRITISLSCDMCRGSGITDWISNICKCPTTSNLPDIDPKNFKRDDKKIYRSDFTNDDNNLVESYYSTAYIDPTLEGIELCKECLGTGIFNISIRSLSKASIHNITELKW